MRTESVKSRDLAISIMESALASELAKKSTKSTKRNIEAYQDGLELLHKLPSKINVRRTATNNAINIGDIGENVLNYIINGVASRGGIVGADVENRSRCNEIKTFTSVNRKANAHGTTKGFYGILKGVVYWVYPNQFNTQKDISRKEFLESDMIVRKTLTSQLQAL